MPNIQGFAATLRGVVTREVDAALAPLRNTLEGLLQLVSEAPARTAPVRLPRKAAPAGRQHRGAKAKGPAEAADGFRVGQAVQYRQGRGTFEARITAIDAAQGVLRLERTTDGKRIVRPATKVAPF